MNGIWCLLPVTIPYTLWAWNWRWMLWWEDFWGVNWSVWNLVILLSWGINAVLWGWWLQTKQALFVLHKGFLVNESVGWFFSFSSFSHALLFFFFTCPRIGKHQNSLSMYLQEITLSNIFIPGQHNMYYCTDLAQVSDLKHLINLYPFPKLSLIFYWAVDCLQWNVSQCC